MTRQSGSSKYCLTCRYCLNHLESNECPECGRGFDPDDEKTFAYTPNRFSWPRWELLPALVLFVVFIVQTRGWLTVKYRHARISWAHDYGWILWRFDDLLWAAPFVCLVPVFIISAFRAKPKNKLNASLCVIMMLAYLAFPQTRDWFIHIGSVITELHEIDLYLESRSGQHP